MKVRERHKDFIGTEIIKVINVKIRIYRKTDRKGVSHLIEEMKDAMIAFDRHGEYDRKKGFGEASLKDMLKGVSQKKGILYVAEDKGKIIGYVVGTLPVLPSKTDLLGLKEPLIKIGEVDEVYVEPNFRRSNVGVKLMGKVEAWLREHGCTVIMVGFFTENKRALSFYNKIGYKVVGANAVKEI